MKKHPIGLGRVLGAGLAALLAASPAFLAAQARDGIVKGTIVNGTTGGPGRAEQVTLFNLSSGMDPVAALGEVSGSFTLDGFQVEEKTPFLLQVTAGGVSYSRSVRFDGGNDVEATVTVYDTTRQWKDIAISMARVLVRREHDRLKVDELYVVENKTEPKRTYYDPEGTFRFHVPSDGLVGSPSVSASSSSSGMPVPQASTPLPDGSGSITTTALKPGGTDIAVSYELDYASETYRLERRILYPLSELLVLIAPADIRVEAGGWENLGPEPDGRFVVFRKTNVTAESSVGLTLSGGSEHAADLTASGREGGSSSGVQVTTLPDPTRPQKWIIVLLMGAALAYGLLTALVLAEKEDLKSADRNALRERLADLERRYASGSVSEQGYRKKKRQLQAQMDRAAGRGKH